MVTIIAAYTTKKRIIGARGTIPWALPLEMVHFKNTTMGNAVIFGRKTFETIGKALPDRKNLVVTKNEKFICSGVQAVSSIEDGIEQAKKAGFESIFICGGGQVYSYAMQKGLADRMIISEIDENRCNSEKLKAADTFFPEIKEKDWLLTSEKKNDGFTVKEYLKRS